MPTSQVLRFGHGSVRVETDPPGDLGWLAECLTPRFCIVHDGRHDAVVTLSREGRRHRALLARGPAPDGARVVCFALDSRTVSHAQFAEAFGRPQVPAAPLQALVLPRPDGDGDALEVTDLAAPEAEWQLQAAFFRAGCEPPEEQAFAFGVAAPGIARLAARCRRLAERVRCVECRLGPAAGAGDPEAKRFPEAVFA